MEKAELGLIGLATMGANFARNIADKGFSICVYNRTWEKTKDFLEQYGNLEKGSGLEKENNLENLSSSKNKSVLGGNLSSSKILGAKELKEFVEKLAKPRKIMLLVKAGRAVDLVIENLLEFLEPGDLIIDLGNSNYKDTKRRSENLESQGFKFLGCGISGGEEGALNGPSLMPGGNFEAYKMMEAVFQKTAAKDFQGKPCVSYVASDGAGHFVKTVHNGIEYGVMQLIAEAYDIYRKYFELDPGEIGDIFAEYNQGKLKSFLFEIAVEVLKKKDDLENLSNLDSSNPKEDSISENSKNSNFLIDKILDQAGQKGTGRWTAIEGLERASSISTIAEAVFARITSGEKELRTKLSKIYKSKDKNYLNSEENKENEKDNINKENKKNYNSKELKNFQKNLEAGLYCALLLTYAQGYGLIQKTANEEGWEINLGEISRIWQGGCIIRAEILQTLHQAFKNQIEKETQDSSKDKKNKTKHLLEIPQITKEILDSLTSLKKLTAFAALNNIALPAHASALNYFFNISSEKSSANMIQALRDNFGAHTYERTDRKGNFHSDWKNFML